VARPAVTVFFMVTVKRSIVAENLCVVAVEEPAISKPVDASEIALYMVSVRELFTIN
jgi:hypothetical protein